MIRKISFIIILLTGTSFHFSQTIATFEIELRDGINGFDVPLSIKLDNVTLLPDSELILLEVQGEEKVPVPFQIIQNEQRELNWILHSGKDQSKYIFELALGSTDKSEKIKSFIDDGALTIHSGNKNFLSYIFKTVYPPEGIDTAYKRSGFIHPLWSPHGQVLTRIQPPDHYHHYGIWNPWTHVLFEGDTVDFWNIGDKKGTVRFANFVSISNGTVFSEYKTLQEHVVFKKDGSEKVALNELQSIRVYKPEDEQNYYFVDITIEMSCATESPVLLLEYRYGGLSWRTTEKWNKENSEVLTSEGKTRKDADGSKANWCIVQGVVDDDYAGIVLMSYSTNYNHPEPLRIWPEDQNGRGDVFANFSPTKDKDWLLEPGKKYVLKYRLLIFNNHLTKGEAESAWQNFVNPPIVKIKRLKYQD